MVSRHSGEEFGNLIFAQRAQQTEIQNAGADILRFIAMKILFKFKTFGIPKPDVFFIFDIPTSLSRKNVAKKGFRGYVGDEADVYEKDVAFLENVRKCYLECASIYPGSVVLNCADDNEEMRPIEEIAKDVIDTLAKDFNIIF